MFYFDLNKLNVKYMNKSLLIIIAITLMGYLSYGQGSVAVYNNSNANYYQKMFTSKVVVYIASVENWSPVDKTDDYASILKDDPAYKKTPTATDEMLVKIAAENGDDYVCNLAIKANLTVNNITASLVNVKTGVAEQKATATCTDLVSSSSLDKAAQEIVDKLLLAPNRKAEEEKRALAEQKANEERTLAAQKAKEAKAQADAEKQAQIDAEKEAKAKAEAEKQAEKQAQIETEREAKAKAEAEKQAQIEAEREAKVKAEAEKQAQIDAEKRAKAIADSLEKDAYFDNSLLKKGERYVLLSHAELKKVRMSSRKCLDFLSNNCPDARNSFSKGRKFSQAGNSLITIGTVSFVAGIGLVTFIYLEGVNSYYTDVDYEKGIYRRYRDSQGRNLLYTGAIVGGVGLVALITGIPLNVKGKHYKRNAIELYNNSCKTRKLSYIEYSVGIQGSGIGFTLQF
ncbi:MAG: hypothetical protein LBT67_02905 [Holosporaceae bacterium]|jgi:hypothetical protein|nr:hypothetical protein [Holosporaceae bacterium]